MYALLCVVCVKEGGVRLTRVDLFCCAPQLSGPGSVAPVRVPPGRYKVVWLLQVAQGHDASVTQVIACRVTAAGKPRWAPVAAHKLIPREVRTYVLAAHRVSWHGSPLCRAAQQVGGEDRRGVPAREPVRRSLRHPCCCPHKALTLRGIRAQVALKRFPPAARSLPDDIKPHARKLVVDAGSQVQGHFGAIEVVEQTGQVPLPVVIHMTVGGVAAFRELRAGPRALPNVLRTVLVLPRQAGGGDE